MITRPRNQGLTVFNYNHIYLALLAGYGLGVSILGIVSAILGSNFIFLMLTSVGFWGNRQQNIQCYDERIAQTGSR